MSLLDDLPQPASEEVDEDAFKQLVADELERVRTRSFGLTTDVLDESELTAQHSRLMSPLVWDLAHVGNYEELWLLREAAGIEAMRPEIDDLYDAFEHPRSERPALPLLSPTEARDYIGLVRRKVLDSLAVARLDPSKPLLADGFVYRMVVQHEHQHDETMLGTHQLRRGDPVLPPATDGLPAPTDGSLLAEEVLVAGGPFVMGTSTDPWAYDNERPAYVVEQPSFWIDTTPVSNASYRAFIEAGGYDDPRWWTPGGWDWRTKSGKRAPAFWVREGTSWFRRRFGRLEPLPDTEPVQHVCYFEADAYARWAGKRLPTEAEWEKAASWDPASRSKRRYPWGDAAPTSSTANLGQLRFHPTGVGSFPAGASAYGVRQLLGDVWEWTSTSFTGHPGFCVFPYKEYSEVFFGDDYKVLRGGSWATDPLAVRNTFRNWDYPIRRQIFAGFRCARTA
ncbi:ergothioneine biosynthesis protein EgtB [Tenggerimyces flavus]|uniref:Hercynine oxygenase n=1 Tax=Tenggerimyces flavus TaxID=1708749 RepID=A0ABV7Y6Q5_9ACTN|nr:ergothioneine biosynthesis protein EgtB [Tenggerimyces flavus]MBM7788403.1 iron(II)-dependent oxidoreductase [Tenggerimyces flavus]